MEFISRFTERAQRALLSAQKEAAAMHRSAVGTEHLLLGVLRDPGPVGNFFERGFRKAVFAKQLFGRLQQRLYADAEHQRQIGKNGNLRATGARLPF